MPTLCPFTHGWRGDGLDHVVPVEALQRLEEVERAARATRAAHVHVDDREAHQVREHRDAARRPGRVGVAVARVLDERRVRRRVRRTARDRRAGREAGLARRARGRVHVGGELRAVAHGQVRVAVGRDRLVVDARIPRGGLVGVHRERARRRAGGDAADAVARGRRHVPEQHAAARVGALRLQRPCPPD